MLVTNPQDLSRQFNEIFVNSDDELIYLNKHFQLIMPPQMMRYKIQEVLLLTSKLKTKISAGFNEIPDMIVKQCIQTIINPLTVIFHLSLNSATFPNQLKIAKVRHIF
jgi:hypothetical protein